MSTDCLDTDTLTSVGAALEWQVPERLEHLAGCAGCRAGLVELARLRAHLLDVRVVEPPLSVAPRPDLRLGAGPAPGGAAARPSRLARALVGGSTLLVAAATLVLALALLG